MEHQALTPWDQRTTMSHRHEEGQHGRLGNRESKRMKKIPWRQWNNKAQQPSRDWECTRILRLPQEACTEQRRQEVTFPQRNKGHRYNKEIKELFVTGGKLLPHYF